MIEKNLLTTPLLRSWINPQYLQEKKVTEIKTKFIKNKPFPHVVLPSFFNEEQVVLLLKALVKEPFNEKYADLFKFMQTNDLKGTKNKTLALFRDVLYSKAFVQYIRCITDLPLKEKPVDLAATLYQDTDYLLCHDDQLEGRKLAFLLYLSEMEEGEGGSLNLFSAKKGTPAKMVTQITPKFNTFAFFEVSPLSFHEVEEVTVDKQRIAIGGWFHA